MKKSLLALAVLGAFAGAASAQTNVTIYGVVDAGISYDSNTAGKKWALESGQQSGSRLGFKGSEDLGGGLSAIFTLENGFNADTGTFGQSNPTTTRLFGRQAWVGLNGGFGSVKLGRQQTPLYRALLSVDPFGIANAGNAQRVFGYGLYVAEPFLRTDNTINYTSTNFSGFTAEAAYAFGEQADNFAAGRSQMFGANYVAGPLNVQFAYQKSNAANVPGSIGTDVVRGTTIAAPATADLRTAFLGGTYDFGVAKAHLAYGDTKAETPALGSVKIRNWLVGATAPISAADSVYASWVRNDIKDAPSAKSDQYGIGYSHSLSKRTNFYTSVSYTKNDDNVRLNNVTGTTAAPTGYGQSDRLFQVGVRHLF